jgi:flagellar motor protein MotB
MTDAIGDRLNTLCINDDTIWEGLNTATTGIAVFGQLMISTSRAPDFQIDMIDKKHIPLIKKPESFRRTLRQIADEVDRAFTKAHTNMEMIRLQMSQVPGYVMNCVKIIQSGNKMVINQDLPRRLENIKKIADNCLKMSKEVCDAFDLLGQLIQQVLLAISASQGAKEQEIQAVIRAKIEQVMKSQLRANNREQENVENQLEIARADVRRSQQRLHEVRQLGIGDLFGFFIASLPLILRVTSAENAVSEAKTNLQRIEQKEKRVEEQRKEIYDDFIKRLKNMHDDVEKEISRDDIIKLLGDGLSHLSKLNSNWVGLTKNFNSISSHIELVTHATLSDFVDDAKDAQEDPFLIDFMTNSINKSLELSNTTHRAAKMYVDFSNKTIVKSLNDMHQSKNTLLPF